MTPTPGPLHACSPAARARVEAIARLEASLGPDDDRAPAVRAVVQLVEDELSRLLLEPLRPCAGTLAEVVEEKSGRRAGDTLRAWSLGAAVPSVAGLASRVLQALRQGLRAGEPRVTTLLEALFAAPFRERVADPELGLALERFRSRFRDPLARDDPAPRFGAADHEDLVRTVLGARSVSAWLEAGAEAPAPLDLLLRGTRLPAGASEAPAGALPETAVEPRPGQRPGERPDQRLPGGDACPLGGRLGPYELQDELGRGGMGVVHRGWDAERGRRVAIKALRGLDVGAEALARFLREGAALARLRHEHIVAVEQVVERAGQPYLVMEFVDGPTLERWLETPRSPAEVARVGRDIAAALGHAHEQGLVHRDVKPSNVMLDPTGRAVLMDFGLALDLGAGCTRLTATGAVLGTPAYMAPEQVEGLPGAVGPAADVYALGATLYRALCGRPPFEASSPAALFKMILLDRPAPPRALNPAVPAPLEALLLRCLARDPAERPASAALAAALEPIAR